LLAKLGRWSFVHRRAAVALWVAFLIVVVGGASIIGATYDANPSLPDSESSRGFDVIDQYFGGIGSGSQGTIVFQAPGGIDDPAVRSSMTALFAETAAQDAVVAVTSPYTLAGASQITADRTIAYATVDLGADVDDNESEALGRTLSLTAQRSENLNIQFGGSAFAEFEPPTAELIGLAFAVVVLILAFGSVLAMGMPIGVALFGVAIGTGLTGLMSNVGSFPDFSVTLGAMIGLGVGIDYALFIVTRYRELAHQGYSALDATVGAISTAGRAVTLAGLTVVISLLGMLLIGVAFISGLGIAAATTVLVTIFASLTLLPAFLGFAQGRVEVTRVRGLVAAGFVALALLSAGLEVGAAYVLIFIALGATTLAVGSFWGPLKRQVETKPERPMNETFWYRWSHHIQDHPWAAVGLATTILLVLATPMLSLQMGFSDAGNFPDDTQTKKAYDLLSDGFGPGFNGPLLVAIELGPEGDMGVAQLLVEALASTDGVQQVSPPIPNTIEFPNAALIEVIPSTSPQDQATVDLVKFLRSDVIPQSVEGTLATVHVTGSVAASIDFTALLASRLLVFIAAVLTLSFLLLIVMFRSLLVPLKAVAMNLLSIGASYGVIVAIFQWGWAGSLVGISGGAPIEPFIPMMLFAIVFGLSMDYEVFLISRIREEYDRTGNAKDSVANGLAMTAKVITAAAAIMVVVFGSFLFDPNRVIKLFGTGLALAVLLDATLVRLLLVPATMELLGDRNWWLPRWLDKLLPNIAHEGALSAPRSPKE